MKTKANQKFKNKFFGPFRVFFAIEKQLYNLKLSTKWKIYDVFYVLLLEQDITKIKQINKLLKPKKKFETKDNKEFKIESIIYSAVYIGRQKTYCQTSTI